MYREELFIYLSDNKNRKKSRRCARDKVKVPLQRDAPEESDLWTARHLFPLDED